MRFAIICNPENRRCQFFIDAVIAQGFERPIVIAYLSLLENKVDLQELLYNVDVLKIESFGENDKVRKKLLALASSLAGNHFSKKVALSSKYEKGRILYAQQQYLGFELLLQSVQKVINRLPNIQLMNAVDDILLMFDKSRCHRFLAEKGIPVIPGFYDVKSFEALLSEMDKRSWNRVFVKANYGSSASGVIAFRRNGRHLQAITSVELVNDNGEVKLYNSLKINVYSDFDSIKIIIDILAKDGLLVEQWIPKASTQNGVFDFRMMAIDGQPMHVIARQSKMPLTNLHLGNKRGDLDEIRSELGDDVWEKVEQLTKKTAKAFSNCLYVGLDILVSNNYQNVYLIEANAFGDLLPNLFIDRLDTYQTTVAYYKFMQDA